MSLGLIIFIAVVIVANYSVTQTKGREVIAEQADKLNYEIGQKIVLKLRERLVFTESLASTLATLGNVLSKDSEIYHQVIPEIINQSGMDNIIAGGGIWPEPNEFEAGVERHSFFWGRNKDGQLEFYNDYNELTGNGYHHEEWYVPAKYLKPGKVYWSKSYMDPYSLEPMVTCSVPIWQGTEFKGVATIDLKLTGLSEFMFEQAQLIGGYAFALDRNDRLLSFPSATGGQSDLFQVNRYVQNEYPTIHDVAKINSGFRLIQEQITKESIKHQSSGGVHEETRIKKLGALLAAESYQIEKQEALRIAHILIGQNVRSSLHHLISVDHDPLLMEESHVTVLPMPAMGWKVVIAMPAEYSSLVVSEITEGMLSKLLFLLAISAIVYMLFFNAVFLVPVNKLTQQIRKLVSREDYVTTLKQNGNDELSQLASWFNVRTAQLSETLDKLKNRNIEISEARNAAENANRSKNIFLASMSHDIRTPMNAIIGMSEVLSKTQLDADQENYTRVINTSSQALLALVNDIMDFSKIEANQLDLEEISFDLHQVMDDCADLIFFQTQEKRLEFIYYLSPDVNRHVIGDPNRIRQIILNLATNAVKFTQTGRVELWLESTFQNDANCQLIIEVRDTGIGLSKSAQQKLFMPFSQGDSSTTRKYGGTGLGLTICKHLAELMGGSVVFRSEEGVGTTFIFKLKLKTKSSLDSQYEVPDAKRYGGGDRRALILSQNYFQNTVLEQYLQSMGINTKVVNSLPAWMAEIDAEPAGDVMTICTDTGLLGDPNNLSERIPGYLSTHSFMVLADKDKHSSFDISFLSTVFSPKVVPLPLKYDVLRKAVAITKPQTDVASIAEVDVSLPLARYSDKRILIVEDNQVNQKVLVIMLGYLGLVADIANDGVEAVEAVELNDYDLILMDWQMPRMDGLEATRKIRTFLEEQRTVIIAVTANAMSGDIDKCLEAGMDDYLSKPIQKDKLEVTLRRWLSMDE
jgi:signal transduction histidine kinase/ActR/RegA family two-component response regulator